MFKECWNSIQDKDRPDMPIIASTPEMVNSVYVPILADWRVTIEDIYLQLGISVIAAHKNLVWWPCFFYGQVVVGFPK